MDNFTIHKVYIKVDANNRVIAVDTDAFISDLTDWIFIDEQTSRHAQSGYFEKSLIDFTNSTHNYIYENEEVRETTDAEKEAELATFPPIPPTTEDRVTTLEGTVTALEAQLDEADMTAVEIYESLLTQTDINDAQDLSIVEIYELLGGM